MTISGNNESFIRFYYSEPRDSSDSSDISGDPGDTSNQIGSILEHSGLQLHEYKELENHISNNSEDWSKSGKPVLINNRFVYYPSSKELHVLQENTPESSFIKNGQLMPQDALLSVIKWGEDKKLLRFVDKICDFVEDKFKPVSLSLHTSLKIHENDQINDFVQKSEDRLLEFKEKVAFLSEDVGLPRSLFYDPSTLEVHILPEIESDIPLSKEDRIIIYFKLVETKFAHSKEKVELSGGSYAMVHNTNKSKIFILPEVDADTFLTKNETQQIKDYIRDHQSEFSAYTKETVLLRDETDLPRSLLYDPVEKKTYVLAKTHANVNIAPTETQQFGAGASKRVTRAIDVDTLDATQKKVMAFASIYLSRATPNLPPDEKKYKEKNEAKIERELAVAKVLSKYPNYFMPMRGFKYIGRSHKIESDKIGILMPAGISLYDTRNDPSLENPKEIVKILHHVALGLGIIHSKGLAYLDFKPDNIVIANGKFYISDFGHTVPFSTTNNTKAVGTTRYLAPELLKTPPILTDKADVFALGITAYQMLMGDFEADPFIQSDNDFSNTTQENAFNDRLQNLCDNIKDSPFKDLIKTCLAFNPKDRPSMAEVVDQLIEIGKKLRSVA